MSKIKTRLEDEAPYMPSQITKRSKKLTLRRTLKVLFESVSFRLFSLLLSSITIFNFIHLLRSLL